MKNTLPALSWLNGRPAQQVPVNDRGLQYGDGLFETILYLDGKLILSKQHIQRLERDCKRLSINIDSISFHNELSFLLRQLEKNKMFSGIVKIIITRESVGRGYGFRHEAGSNRMLQFYPDISYPENNRKAVRLSLANYRLACQPALAGIKHLNRLDQILLQQELRKLTGHEIVACDENGYVIEGSFSNLFIVKDGVVITPKLDGSGVRGIMRDYLLDEILPKLEIPSAIKKITVPELVDADEAFICNSVFGIWPVVSVNVASFRVGSCTRKIQSSVDKLGYPRIHH